MTARPAIVGERFHAESNGDEPEIKRRIAKREAFQQSIQTVTRTRGSL
jgi:hypothetical protein